LKCLNKGIPLENNFIILAVNGNFKKSISDPQSEQKLNEEYTNWLNSPKEREKNISSKFGKIDKQNSEIINGIKLSEIMVDEAYVQTIKNNYPKGESPLKHEYLISYLGERMGKIVVYAI